jgi:hypothetical protein
VFVIHRYEESNASDEDAVEGSDEEEEEEEEDEDGEPEGMRHLLAPRIN